MVSGFAFQNCNPFEVDCNCPPFLGDYFDIQGIELINYKKRGECCVDKILGNEEVKFSDYHGLTIDYVVEYHTSNYNCMVPLIFSFRLLKFRIHILVAVNLLLFTIILFTKILNARILLRQMNDCCGNEWRIMKN